MSTVSSSTSTSSMLRITGMASGLDVDGIVKKLMAVEQLKVDKVKQSKQLLQWTQDSYRDTLGGIKTFKSTYLDFANPAKNMLSLNSYTGLSATQDTTGSVTVTPSVGAAAGNYSVKVDSLAAGASLSNSSVTDNRNNMATISDIANWRGQTITFSVDGSTTNSTITIDNSVTNSTDLAAYINNKIATDPNASALNGKLAVSSTSNGTLQFNSLSTNTIKINASTVTTDLDNKIGKVMNPTSLTKLSDLGINSGTLKISYNGVATPVSVNVDNTKTVGDLVSAINNGGSGNFTASFSELTGKLDIKTTKMGTSASISYSDVDLSNLGLVAQNTPQNGTDAIIELTPPGSSTTTTVVKNTNNFTIDNVNYSLIKKTTAASSFSLNVDTQVVYDKIKEFIDKYNDMISNISIKIDEKKLYDYAPLTDDQKSSMTETQITAWENKAKQGLLKNDSNLETMLSQLRTAFYDKVSAAGLSLTDVGLSTSSDTTQRGRIVYDETKLKTAIQNNGDKVAKLFMNSSSISYDPDHSAYDVNDATSRYAQEGIFQRVNDILDDYTRTTRDKSNRKGILLEKAGIKGDFTEFNNLLSKQMSEKDTKISDLSSKMFDKENAYYAKFSKLESAMNNYNSQSAWLTKQFS